MLFPDELMRTPRMAFMHLYRTQQPLQEPELDPQVEKLDKIVKILERMSANTATTSNMPRPTSA